MFVCWFHYRSRCLSWNNGGFSQCYYVVDLFIFSLFLPPSRSVVGEKMRGLGSFGSAQMKSFGRRRRIYFIIVLKCTRAAVEGSGMGFLLLLLLSCRQYESSLISVFLPPIFCVRHIIPELLAVMLILSEFCQYRDCSPRFSTLIQNVTMWWMPTVLYIKHLPTLTDII